MPFLSQELENAFFVYNDRCGQNFTYPSGASAGAKHGEATILSCELGIVMARILGYNDFASGLLAFVDMLQRTLVGAHRLARYHKLRSHCC
jgi:hypothetical protein